MRYRIVLRLVAGANEVGEVVNIGSSAPSTTGAFASLHANAPNSKMGRVNLFIRGKLFLRCVELETVTSSCGLVCSNVLTDFMCASNRP